MALRVASMTRLREMQISCKPLSSQFTHSRISEANLTWICNLQHTSLSHASMGGVYSLAAIKCDAR